MTDIMLGHANPSWPVYRLGQLFRERREKVNDRDFPPLSVTKHGIVPQLETAAKSDDGDNRKGVRAGDFVINSRSDRKGSGGLSELDGSVSLINIVLEPLGIHPRFAHHLLRSTAFQEEFYRWGHGIVADLWTTRYSDMKSIRLAVPDLETQKTIADFLDCETARIDQLIEKKQRLLQVMDLKWAAIVTRTLTVGLQPSVPFKYSGVPWIGDVPSHWKVLKLGHIGRCANGINIPGEAFGSGYPFVSYGDVYKNPELPHTVTGLVESTSADRARYDLRKGDVLFTRTSEIVEEIGLSSVCMRDVSEAVYAGFLIRFRPKKNALIPHYSKFLFRNDALRSFFAREMMIVTRASLSQGLLQRMPVILPPLEEQAQIAAYLEKRERAHRSASEKTTSSIERLREFRAALITAAITGQIDGATFGRRPRTERLHDLKSQPQRKGARA